MKDFVIVCREDLLLELNKVCKAMENEIVSLRRRETEIRNEV